MSKTNVSTFSADDWNSSDGGVLRGNAIQSSVGTSKATIGAIAPPPTVSIILSFWNEANNIPELVRRLRTVLGRLQETGEICQFELVFINDASTDNSEQLIRQAAIGHGDIRLLNMSRKFGNSPCNLAGMEFAAGDVVITMDVDLQDPPEVIPEMIAAYRSEQDVGVVHTIRRRRNGETKVKLWITALGYKILKIISSIELPIEAGDFKLVARKAVHHLVQLREKRPFLRGMVCWIGFKQKNVNYVREGRYSGRSKFPVFGINFLRNFLDSALISFSDLPLRLAIFAGGIVSLLAMIYLLWIVTEILRGHIVPGFSAIMVTMLFLGGVQLLCMGMQGLYISSIFLETKGRPNFIVQDTFGFENQEKLKAASTLSHESSAIKPDASADAASAGLTKEHL